MKKTVSYLLIPSNPKLADNGSLWLEYQSYDAAEDAQIEYADRALDYDIVIVRG